MSIVDGVTSSLPVGRKPSQPEREAVAEAKSAIGEVGYRVLSWATASTKGNTPAPIGEMGSTDVSSGFLPDAGELARRGDVYGLRSLSGEIAGRMGATPAQEGALHRALEDFTRAAVVPLAGLTGSDRQGEVLARAIGVAEAAPGGDGVEGVTQRLEAATAHLVEANGEG
jgi:hypothetical protein